MTTISDSKSGKIPSSQGFTWVLGVLILGLVVSLLVLVRSRNQEPEKLPILGNLPEFSLLNQEGAQVRAGDLKGHTLVVNFIFTSCPDTCPLLTAQMAKIQNQLKERNLSDQVRLVSITVDPATDTSSVLKTYAERYHADFSTWTFLTGSVEEVQNVVVSGFKIAMEKVGASAQTIKDVNIMDITHGEQFVIIDKAGNIRAYRSANNNSDIDRIFEVVGKVI